MIFLEGVPNNTSLYFIAYPLPKVLLFALGFTTLTLLHPHFQPRSLHMASRTLDYQFFHLVAYLWSYLS
jgi:hypothetical protein